MPKSPIPFAQLSGWERGSALTTTTTTNHAASSAVRLSIDARGIKSVEWISIGPPASKTSHQALRSDSMAYIVPNTDRYPARYYAFSGIGCLTFCQYIYPLPTENLFNL